MSQEKDIKRSVRSVWERVRTLRRERKKLRSPEDLETSSQALAQCASDLSRYAKAVSALSAMPPDASLSISEKPKRKRKNKPIEPT
jgi:hypothetical protein